MGFIEDGFQHRMPLTLDASKVDSDQTDITLVFDESFLSFFTSVNGPLDADGDCPSLDGGGDIRFSSDADGENRMALDIRRWETQNDPATGKCEFAVKVPSLSSAVNTTIHMWWGKSGATQPAVGETYGQYDAYDANTKNWWSLGELSGWTDRTGNNSLTENGTVTTSSGIVGDAAQFDGNNSNYLSASISWLDGYSGSLTVACWNYADRADGDQLICGHSSNKQSMHFWCDSSAFGTGRSNTFTFKTSDSPRLVSDASAWLDGTWQHIACTKDSSSDLRMWIDAVAQSDNPVNDVSTLYSSGTFGVGKSPWIIDAHHGNVDELRLSDTNRSEAWLKVEYHNQNNTSGFLTAGTQVNYVTGAASIELPVPTFSSEGQNRVVGTSNISLPVPTVGVAGTVSTNNPGRMMLNFSRGLFF